MATFQKMQSSIYLFIYLFCNFLSYPLVTLDRKRGKRKEKGKRPLHLWTPPEKGSPKIRAPELTSWAGHIMVSYGLFCLLVSFITRQNGGILWGSTRPNLGRCHHTRRLLQNAHEKALQRVCPIQAMVPIRKFQLAPIPHGCFSGTMACTQHAP